MFAENPPAPAPASNGTNPEVHRLLKRAAEIEADRRKNVDALGAVRTLIQSYEALGEIHGDEDTMAVGRLFPRQFPAWGAAAEKFDKVADAKAAAEKAAAEKAAAEKDKAGAKS